MKFGVIAYKDHQLNENAYLTRIQPLTDEAKAIEFIAGLTSDGGGDICEAVLDGLHQAVTHAEWRSDSTKFIFHIADAPPHGKQYAVPHLEDDYPEGCPCGIKLEDIAKVMNEKKIRYRLLDIVLDPRKFNEKYRKAIEASNQGMKKMISVFSHYFGNLENKQLREAHEVTSAVTQFIVTDIAKIETSPLI